MKKVYFLFCALMAATVAIAQTVPNAGMESWRTSTSGPIAAKTVQAPDDWFGTDSLTIAVGEEFLMDPTLVAQLFEENTIIHGGSHSAKIMTLYQDSTIGILPGTLTNSQVSLDVAALLGGGSLASALSFSGGTPVTLKITTVSAYVEYFPGIDSGTHTRGADTGLLNVEAYAIIGGVDSLIGTGIAFIPSTPTFTQITATLAYTDTVDSVGLVRIFFTSGGGARTNLDSSTLYVDDVSMTGEAEPIPPVSRVVNAVNVNAILNVYPNPASGAIYIDGPQNAGLTCSLLSVSGQVVATKTLMGNDVLDVSGLPAGIYIYTISDRGGNTVQKGKVTLVK